MLHVGSESRASTLEQDFQQAMMHYAAYLSSQELAAFMKGAQLTANLEPSKAQQLAAFKAGVQFAAKHNASLDRNTILTSTEEAAKRKIAKPRSSNAAVRDCSE